MTYTVSYPCALEFIIQCVTVLCLYSTCARHLFHKFRAILMRMLLFVYQETFGALRIVSRQGSGYLAFPERGRGEKFVLIPGRVVLG